VSLLLPAGCVALALGGLPSAPDPAAAASDAERVFATYPTRTPLDNAKAMEAIVDRGDFPGRARVLAWLGTQYTALGDFDSAEHWLRRARAEYPDDVWGKRALLGLGQVAAQRRRYLQAESFFREAAAALSDERADALRRAEAAREAFYALLVFVAGWLAVAGFVARGVARGARGGGWALPFEVKLLAPLLACFVIMSIPTGADVRLCVGLMSAGTLLLLYSNALALRERPRWPWLHVLHGLISAAGVTYGAIYASGLTDAVMETLRLGAGR